MAKAKEHYTYEVVVKCADVRDFEAAQEAALDLQEKFPELQVEVRSYKWFTR